MEAVAEDAAVSSSEILSRFFDLPSYGPADAQASPGLFYLGAGRVSHLGGESPLDNLMMEVKS
jgi:hypothetical protein